MPMLEQLFKHSVVYGLAGVLSRGIAIVMVPVFTRLLAPEEYGALDLLTVFATIANYVVAAEITQGVARLYSEASGDRDRQRIASTSLWFCALAYGVFIFFGLVFAAPLAELLLGSNRWAGIFRVAVVAIAANGVFYLFQNLLRWQILPRRYAVASLIYSLVSIAATVYLLVFAESGVAGVFWGQVIGAVCGIASSWWYSRQSYGYLFSGQKLREMLSFSLPLVPSSIAVYLALYVDRIAINELMTLEAVGIYGVGARIASVVALLMMGFQGALTPLVIQNYGNPSTPAQLARIFRYFFACALPILVLLALFSHELVWLFATPSYYGARSVIPVLGLSTVIAGMYVFAPGLFIRKKTWIFAMVNTLAAATNLGLNVLLIPIAGIMGASFATLTTAIAAFTSFMALSQRLYPVPHDWARIAAASAISGIIVVASTQVSGSGATISIGEILAKAAVFLLTGAICAWALLGRAEIYAILGRLRRDAARSRGWG